MDVVGGRDGHVASAALGHIEKARVLGEVPGEAIDIPPCVFCLEAEFVGSDPNNVAVFFMETQHICVKMTRDISYHVR